MDNSSSSLRTEPPSNSSCVDYLEKCAKYKELNEMISENDLALVREYCVDKDVTSEEFEALQTDDTDFRCVPPLCVAAMVDAAEIIEYLLDLGFDPNAHECGTADDLSDKENGCNPIQISAANGALNAARVLATQQRVDINYPCDSPYSPLMLAIDANDLAMVRLLVEADADTSPGKAENTSPLHCAASFNYWEICKYLVSSGTDVNAMNSSGYTALHSACNGGSCYTFADAPSTRRNCLEAARVLVDAGADVNAVSFRSKASPLFIAVSENCLELVTFLCSRGADPELPNKSGNTPLHIAVTDARYDIARYLVVDLNVDMEVRTFHSHSTPFKFALCNKSEKAVRLLLGAGHDPDVNCRRSLSNIVEQYHENFHWQEEEGLEEEEEEERHWYMCSTYAQQVASNPRTLQQLCCFSIRRILGEQVSTKLSNLDLPHIVNDIITLSHL